MSEQASAKRGRGWLIRLWLGELSLPMAFWGFYFLGQIPSILFAAIIGAIFLALSDHSTEMRAIFIVVAAYWLFAGVGVWRSASSYKGWGGWTILAKLVVVWFALAQVLLLLIARKM